MLPGHSIVDPMTHVPSLSFSATTSLPLITMSRFQIKTKPLFMSCLNNKFISLHNNTKKKSNVIIM